MAFSDSVLVRVYASTSNQVLLAEPSDMMGYMNYKQMHELSGALTGTLRRVDNHVTIAVRNSLQWYTTKKCSYIHVIFLYMYTMYVCVCMHCLSRCTCECIQLKYAHNLLCVVHGASFTVSLSYFYC